MSWGPYSSIELPRELPGWVVDVVVGQFPKALEGMMAWLADEIDRHAEDVRRIAERVSSVVDRMAVAGAGASVDRMVAQGRQLATAHQQLATVRESQAGQLRSGGEGFREAKIAVIAAAIELAVQETASLVLLVASPAAAAADVAVQQAETESTTRAVVRKLMETVLLQGLREQARRAGLLWEFELAWGAVQGELPQLIAQAMTGDWNVGELEDAAVSGGLGAVVAAPVTERLSERMAPMLNRAVARGLSDNAATALLRKLVTVGGVLTSSAVGGMVGGAAGVTGTAVMTGHVPVPADLVSGLESGAASGAVFGMGGAAAGVRAPEGRDVGPQPVVLVDTVAKETVAKLLTHPRITAMGEIRGPTDAEILDFLQTYQPVKVADAESEPVGGTAPQGDGSRPGGYADAGGDDAQPATGSGHAEPPKNTVGSFAPAGADRSGHLSTHWVVPPEGRETTPPPMAPPPVAVSSDDPRMQARPQWSARGSDGASAAELSEMRPSTVRVPRATSETAPAETATTAELTPEPDRVSATAQPVRTPPHAPTTSPAGDDRGSPADKPTSVAAATGAPDVRHLPSPQGDEFDGGDRPADVYTGHTVPEAMFHATFEFEHAAAFHAAYAHFADDFGMLSGSILRDMLTTGTVRERVLAAVEIVRRVTVDAAHPTGLELRTDQIYGALRMSRRVIEMDPGMGKSAMFLMHGLLRMGQGQTVHYMTVAPELANRDFRMFDKIAGALGFDVHRVDQNRPMVEKVDGHGAIHVGTPDDYAHAANQGYWRSGDFMMIDEIDAVVKWMNVVFSLAEGTAEKAPKPLADYIRSLRACFAEAYDKGILTDADLSHRLDDRAGRVPPHFTEPGRQKAEKILDEWFTRPGNVAIRDRADVLLKERAEWMKVTREGRAEDLARLELAAQARWYRTVRLNDAYVIEKVNTAEHDRTPVSEWKVLLVNEANGSVNADFRTGTVSRWSKGLAEAVEAEHGADPEFRDLAIRESARTLEEITIHELLRRYPELSGASGTARGSSDVLNEQLGLDEPERVERPEEFKSQLIIDEPVVAGLDHETKLNRMADDIVAEFLGDTSLPQLVVCDRNSEVAVLTDLVRRKLWAGGITGVDDVLTMADAHTESAMNQAAALGRGPSFDEHWARVTARAGKRVEVLSHPQGSRGRITIAGRYAARGTDAPIGADVEADGGLVVLCTARSALSEDLDKQVFQRAGRTGEVWVIHPDGSRSVVYRSQRGRAVFYLSPDDDLFHTTDPHADPIVTHYKTAYRAHEDDPTEETEARLTASEKWIRGLATHLQETAHPTGVAARDTSIEATATAPRHHAAGDWAAGRRLARALAARAEAAPAESVPSSAADAPVSDARSLVAAARAAGPTEAVEPVPVHWVVDAGGALLDATGHAVDNHGILTVTLTVQPADSGLSSGPSLTGDEVYGQLAEWAAYGGQGVAIYHHAPGTSQPVTIAEWDLSTDAVTVAAVAQLDAVDRAVVAARASVAPMNTDAEIPADVLASLAAALTAGLGLFAAEHRRGRAIRGLAQTLHDRNAAALKREGTAALAAIAAQVTAARRALSDQVASQLDTITALRTADGAYATDTVGDTVGIAPADVPRLGAYVETLMTRLERDPRRAWLAKAQETLRELAAAEAGRLREVAVGVSDLVDWMVEQARESTVVTVADGQPTWHLPLLRADRPDGADGRQLLRSRLARALGECTAAPTPSGSTSAVMDVADVTEALAGRSETDVRWIVEHTGADGTPVLQEWAGRARKDDKGTLNFDITPYTPTDETVRLARNATTIIPAGELVGRITRAWAGRAGRQVNITHAGESVMSWEIVTPSGLDQAMAALDAVESAVRQATAALGSADAGDAVIEALRVGHGLLAGDSAVAGRVSALIQAARAPTAVQEREIEVALAVLGARVVLLRYLAGREAEHATGRVAQLAGDIQRTVDLTGCSRDELFQRARGALAVLPDNDPRYAKALSLAMTLESLRRDNEPGGVELESVTAGLEQLNSALLDEQWRPAGSVYRLDGKTVTWPAAVDTASPVADDNITTLLAAHERVWLDVAWQDAYDSIGETLARAMRRRYGDDAVGQELDVLLADPEGELEKLRADHGSAADALSRLPEMLGRYFPLDAQRRLADAEGSRRYHAQLDGVAAGVEQPGADQETVVRLPQWCVVMALMTRLDAYFLLNTDHPGRRPGTAIDRGGVESAAASFLAEGRKTALGNDRSTAFRAIAEYLGCTQRTSADEAKAADGRSILLHIDYPNAPRPADDDHRKTGSQQFRPAGDDMFVENRNGTMVCSAMIDGRMVRFTESELDQGIRFWMTRLDGTGRAVDRFLDDPLEDNLDHGWAEKYRQSTARLRAEFDERARKLGVDPALLSSAAGSSTWTKEFGYLRDNVSAGDYAELSRMVTDYRRLIARLPDQDVSVPNRAFARPATHPNSAGAARRRDDDQPTSQPESRSTPAGSGTGEVTFEMGEARWSAGIDPSQMVGGAVSEQAHSSGFAGGAARRREGPTVSPRPSSGRASGSDHEPAAQIDQLYEDVGQSRDRLIRFLAEAANAWPQDLEDTVDRMVRTGMHAPGELWRECGIGGDPTPTQAAELTALITAHTGIPMQVEQVFRRGLRAALARPEITPSTLIRNTELRRKLDSILSGRYVPTPRELRILGNAIGLDRHRIGRALLCYRPLGGYIASDGSTQLREFFEVAFDYSGITTAELADKLGVAGQDHLVSELLGPRKRYRGSNNNFRSMNERALRNSFDAVFGSPEDHAVISIILSKHGEDLTPQQFTLLCRAIDVDPKLVKATIRTRYPDLIPRKWSRGRWLSRYVVCNMALIADVAHAAGLSYDTVYRAMYEDPELSQRDFVRIATALHIDQESIAEAVNQYYVDDVLAKHLELDFPRESGMATPLVAGPALLKWSRTHQREVLGIDSDTTLPAELPDADDATAMVTAAWGLTATETAYHVHGNAKRVDPAAAPRARTGWIANPDLDDMRRRLLDPADPTNFAFLATDSGRLYALTVTDLHNPRLLLHAVEAKPTQQDPLAVVEYDYRDGEVDDMLAAIIRRDRTYHAIVLADGKPLAGRNGKPYAHRGKGPRHNVAITSDRAPLRRRRRSPVPVEPPAPYPAINPALSRLTDRSPTLAELQEYARELVRQYPGLCELRQVGTSRRGKPMEMLIVHADQSDAPVSLVYAGVHSNEPWGNATVRALMDYTTTEPVARQRAWMFLLCLDPDGAEMGEGWVDHVPLSTEAAIRTLYRSGLQPEFDIAKKSVIPESRALLMVIGGAQPSHGYSLHNCVVEFPFVIVTDDTITNLVDIVTRSGMKTNMPWIFSNELNGFAEELAPGVYRAFSDTPWNKIVDDTRTSGTDHSMVLLAIEGPMWRMTKDPMISAGRAIDVCKEKSHFLQGLLERLPVDPDSEMYRAAEFALETGEDEFLEEYFGDDRNAATGAASALWAHLWPLRSAGMMWRYVRELPAADRARFSDIERELDRLIHEWSQHFDELFGIEPMSLADTVAYQMMVILGTSLATAAEATDTTGANDADTDLAGRVDELDRRWHETRDHLVAYVTAAANRRLGQFAWQRSASAWQKSKARVDAALAQGIHSPTEFWNACGLRPALTPLQTPELAALLTAHTSIGMQVAQAFRRALRTRTVRPGAVLEAIIADTRLRAKVSAIISGEQVPTRQELVEFARALGLDQAHIDTAVHRYRSPGSTAVDESRPDTAGRDPGVTSPETGPPAAGGAARRRESDAAAGPEGSAPWEWVRNLDEVMEGLGDSPKTVAQLREYAQEMVRRYPGLCELQTVGVSRRGRPLEMLVVHGDRPNAPIIEAHAGAHSDEPLVNSTLYGLMTCATTEPTARRLTWRFLLCLDPDSAALGEGWVRSPWRNIENYLRTGFRALRQPEWFYSGRDSLLSESLALASVVLGSNLIVSLHNCPNEYPSIGLTENAVTDMVDAATCAAAETNMPNAFGAEFDTLGEKLGIGVYRLNRWHPLVRIADDATDGSGTAALGFTVEGTIFRLRRDLEYTVVQTADTIRKKFDTLQEIFNKMPRDSECRTVRRIMKVLPHTTHSDNYLSAEMMISEAPAFFRRMLRTYGKGVANPADAATAYLQPMRTAAPMWQYARELLADGYDDPGIVEAEGELDQLLHDWSVEFELLFDPEPMLLRDTVGFQMRTILAAVRSIIPTGQPAVDDSDVELAARIDKLDEQWRGSRDRLVHHMATAADMWPQDIKEAVDRMIRSGVRAPVEFWRGCGLSPDPPPLRTPELAALIAAHAGIEMQVTQAFRHALRAALDRPGMTLSKLVSNTAVRRKIGAFVNGEQVPTPAELKILGRALGLDRHHLERALRRYRPLESYIAVDGSTSLREVFKTALDYSGLTIPEVADRTGVPGQAHLIYALLSLRKQYPKRHNSNRAMSDYRRIFGSEEYFTKESIILRKRGDGDLTPQQFMLLCRAIDVDRDTIRVATTTRYPNVGDFMKSSPGMWLGRYISHGKAWPADVARELDQSTDFIYDIVSGRVEPSRRCFVLIAEKLGIDQETIAEAADHYYVDEILAEHLREEFPALTGMATPMVGASAHLTWGREHLRDVLGIESDITTPADLPDADRATALVTGGLGLTRREVAFHARGNATFADPTTAPRSDTGWMTVSDLDELRDRLLDPDDPTNLAFLVTDTGRMATVSVTGLTNRRLLYHDVEAKPTEINPLAVVESNHEDDRAHDMLNAFGRSTSTVHAIVIANGKPIAARNGKPYAHNRKGPPGYIGVTSDRVGSDNPDTPTHPAAGGAARRREVELGLDRMPTLAQLEGCAPELVEQYPGLCEVRQIGISRNDAPIMDFVVHADLPDAPKTLVYTGIHANEARTGATMARLMNDAIIDPTLRNQTWHFISCVDPDGAAQAQEWAYSHQPLSTEDLSRTHFRQDDQVEWSFHEEDLATFSTMPEILAFAKVLETVKPDRVFSLHGCPLEYASVGVTGEVPDMWEIVARAAAIIGMDRLVTIDEFDRIGEEIGTTDDRLHTGLYMLKKDYSIGRIGSYLQRVAGDESAVVVTIEGRMARPTRNPNLTVDQASALFYDKYDTLRKICGNLPDDIPDSNSYYHALKMYMNEAPELYPRKKSNAPADNGPTPNPVYVYEFPMRIAGLLQRVLRNLTNSVDPVMEEVARALARRGTGWADFSLEDTIARVDSYIEEWGSEYDDAFGIVPEEVSKTAEFQAAVVRDAALARYPSDAVETFDPVRRIDEVDEQWRESRRQLLLWLANVVNTWPQDLEETVDFAIRTGVRSPEQLWEACGFTTELPRARVHELAALIIAHTESGMQITQAFRHALRLGLERSGGLRDALSRIMGRQRRDDILAGRQLLTVAELRKVGRVWGLDREHVETALHRYRPLELPTAALESYLLRKFFASALDYSGLTYSELAEKLQLPRSRIVQLLNRDHDLSFREFRRLCRAIDLDPTLIRAATGSIMPAIRASDFREPWQWLLLQRQARRSTPIRYTRNGVPPRKRFNFDDISDEEIADRTGIGIQRTRQILAGNEQPDRSEFVKIAGVMELDPQDIAEAANHYFVDQVLVEHLSGVDFESASGFDRPLVGAPALLEWGRRYEREVLGIDSDITTPADMPDADRATALLVGALGLSEGEVAFHARGNAALDDPAAAPRRKTGWLADPDPADIVRRLRRGELDLVFMTTESGRVYGFGVTDPDDRQLLVRQVEGKPMAEDPLGTVERDNVGDEASDIVDALVNSGERLYAIARLHGRPVAVRNGQPYAHSSRGPSGPVGVVGGRPPAAGAGYTGADPPTPRVARTPWDQTHNHR